MNRQAFPLILTTIAALALSVGGAIAHSATLQDAVSTQASTTDTASASAMPLAMPLNIAGQQVTAITTGWYHTCALTGEGGVKCWGRNNNGQIGDGTTFTRTTPVNVITTSVTAIAAGAMHTCALTQEGGVKCWGLNFYGQLGDGTTTTRLAPVDVSGLSSGIQAIAAGDGHTCALTGESGVKCWGSNSFGELGDGTIISRSTPVDVVGLDSGVAAVATGREYTCVLTDEDGVKCWGGDLGPTPTDISGLTSGVTAIDAGAWHACALTSGGGIKCWGRNSYGQLGDGTTTDRPTPVDVSGLTIGTNAISLGWQHTCALTDGGGAVCWGRNDFGQLGSSWTITQHLTPVAVNGLSSGVTAIAAGGGGYFAEHTCALTSRGGVKCWGANDYGQLGDGTMVWRFTPADAIGLEGGARLSINPPAKAEVGSLVYVPISITDVLTSDDLSGVQIGVRVSDTAILTPASGLSPRSGNLFPAGSLTHSVALTNGWDFILTATLSPTEAISGAGIIVEFPFYALAEGCVDITFADHLLANSSAQLVDHYVTPGRICLTDKGTVTGTAYLQSRTTGHFTDTPVTLTGARGTYTTTTDAAGHFTLTKVYSGTYTAYFTRTLFVYAVRTPITVTSWTTTTLPEVGLWAGDMKGDGDVDNPDWYICAAASIPVDDPMFDITGDYATDVRDCTVLGTNIGRPNMSTTNPPRANRTVLARSASKLATLQNVGEIIAVPLGNTETVLRVVNINGQLYAAGARLELPAGTTVLQVELLDRLAGGFLNWHQDDDTLYIVVAPHEGDTLTQDTNMVLVRLSGEGEVTIQAANPVGEPNPHHLIFLPLIVRE